MWKMIFWMVLLLTAPYEIAIGQQDPCSEQVYSTIPHLPKRNPSYAMDAVPLCDRYLQKQWYRAGFHSMPTFGPNLTDCGTLYPYWMNGTLPENGTVAIVTVCQVGFENKCATSHTINVKNCGLYAVYELTPLTSCNAAYCFQPSTKCVEEVPTNISVSYHNVSWESLPNETASLRIHKPSVNLICNFEPINNTELLYEVNWYIHNKEVLKNQTLNADEIMNALLSASQILKINGRAGSLIHCIVGAKFRATDSPCRSKSSPLFFAGIKLLTERLEIKKNESAILKYQFTIPFATNTMVIDNEEVDAFLFINTAVLKENSTYCDDENNRHCETKLASYKYSERWKYSTDEWKDIRNLTFYNSDDSDYIIKNHHVTLRLTAEGTGGENMDPVKIFDKVFLPDVKVFITEPTNVWKGRYCSSTTDPNIYTFDRVGSPSMLIGTFLLYKNKVYNQEVQEKHYMCHPEAACNCAVAVRSGRDIFTMDICNGGQQIINFPLCDDSVLKVVKKNDRLYKVLLPTGTVVDISIYRSSTYRWFLKIYIYPSPSDVENTEGLCGFLDGNKANDHIGRDKIFYNRYSDSDSFSRTWRVESHENLFMNSEYVYNSLQSISNTMMRVCSCDNSTGTWVTHCNYGTVLRLDCKFAVGKRYNCITHPDTLRRCKRDIDYLQSIKNSSPWNQTLLYQRYKRQTLIKKMPYEEAKIKCLSVFEESKSYNTCLKFVADMENSSLENCISDLQITGMEEYITIHLEETLEICSTFILLNSTFKEENPKVTYQIQTLCPWNCSGNGVCSEGNCTCYTGYAGSDCAFDLSGPPEISHTSDFGFCDKSKESCDEITIYGKYFMENMNTLCYMTRLLYDVGGSLMATEVFQTELEERTLFEGFCSLQYSNTATWVSFFQFNISHDGNNFTETFNVYTFQSLCQEYHNESGKIYYAFKEGFCFIDGLCIPDRATNPENLCEICNVAINRYRWTHNEGLCLIDGRCIASGGRDKSNFCKFCNPTSSNTSWSLYEESCFIDNRCYFKRESRQNNNCEICNPDKNQNNWTLNEECITTQHPNKDTSTESTKESTTPVIETRQSSESTTIGQSTDPIWLTPSSTREEMATSTSTGSTSSEAEQLSDSLSDTDIIIILCTSGIIIVVVIIIAIIVYHSRILTKHSKTRWTIPNITSTSKELPGISLMSYTKN